ncbi:MAG: hypothetical protein ACUVTX_04725 [Bacteroidales bacterium]
MKSRFFTIAFEVVWIIMGIISLAAGMNLLLSGSWKRAIVFFIMALVSFAFARFRHLQRKKL